MVALTDCIKPEDKIRTCVRCVFYDCQAALHPDEPYVGLCQQGGFLIHQDWVCPEWEAGFNVIAGNNS